MLVSLQGVVARGLCFSPTSFVFSLPIFLSSASFLFFFFSLFFLCDMIGMIVGIGGGFAELRIGW